MNNVKVVVEIDPEKTEEIVVRAREASDTLYRLQNAISAALSKPNDLAVRSGDAECFLSPDEILFAETSGGRVWIHTPTDIFSWPLTLHELEEVLPRSFVRASKGILINTARVRALTRTATGVGEARFIGSEKKTALSRMYFKAVRDVIEETRLKK